jgi:radical SAM protein with 4Fe4S-binding SPASM domain
MKSRKRSKEVYADKHPFDLPRSIAKALKNSVDTHAVEVSDGAEGIKYLWLYFSSDGTARGPGGQQKELGADEWLNILDEAASLGVECVLACVATPLADQSNALSLCQWAQDIHDMSVGVFIHSGRMGKDDVEVLAKLKCEKTCLFLREECADDAAHATEQGINVCSGSVTPEDHTPPCDLPEDMLCVGPDGSLYTCGLVLGHEKFKLGNALATPLRQVVDDDSLPRTVPHDAPYEEHKCDACPPIMAKRVMEFGKQKAP